MREVELKMSLTDDQERRLRQSQVLKALSDGAGSTKTLLSVYYDTADHALRRSGIALRLRRDGRRWIQTVKKATETMSQGLSQPLEFECQVRGQNLALSRIEDDDLREDVLGLARAGVAPVVETRFKRTAHLIRTSGTLIELAIDKGEVSANGASQPLLEVELELKAGDPGDLYALAAQLFDRGPIRFSDCSKSERALRLLNGTADDPPALRKSRRVSLRADMSVEQTAHAILTEGLSQALPNVARVIDMDDPNGPHQLRVGLRRLRSALTAFRPALGRAALAPWNDQARDIGARVGALRDLDVLATDLIAPLAAEHEGEPGFPALLEAVEAQRVRVRAEVRDYLASAQVTAFGFGFAEFLARRGWLDPADHDQTLRLAQSILPFGQKALTKRWKAVSAYGARIKTLTIEERHEMRKEIKKMRYLLDAFRTLFDPTDVATFNSLVKKLQTAFGALNDTAMAEMVLSAEDGPGALDPGAARAAGRVIGHLQAKSDHAWPDAMANWTALAEFGAFWARKR